MMFLAASTTMHSAYAKERQTPSKAGLQRLSAYQGTWDATVQDFDTAYSKAGTSHRTILNECWTSVAFFACGQIVDGKPKALIVYTYDPSRDIYHTYEIPADGGPPSGGGTLMIKGSTWEYPSKFTYKGRSLQVRVINEFVSPSKINFRRQYSEDGHSWITISKGAESKLNSPRQRSRLRFH